MPDPGEVRVTDDRLHDLERAWTASGSVEDEVVYLRERVRLGDLSHEALTCAARWGHEAAGLLTGVDPTRPPPLQHGWRGRPGYADQAAAFYAWVSERPSWVQARVLRIAAGEAIKHALTHTSDSDLVDRTSHLLDWVELVDADSLDEAIAYLDDRVLEAVLDGETLYLSAATSSTWALRFRCLELGRDVPGFDLGEPAELPREVFLRSIEAAIRGVGHEALIAAVSRKFAEEALL